MVPANQEPDTKQAPPTLSESIDPGKTKQKNQEIWKLILAKCK